MIETLYVYALLLQVGILGQDEYDHYLDDLFLKNIDNDLLFELERSASDLNHVLFLLQKYTSKNEIDYNVLGRTLLKKLKKIYDHYETDIAYFAARMYILWNLLPAKIQTIHPFSILSYADDPLSWGDGQQTRDLYAQAFQFYEQLSLF